MSIHLFNIFLNMEEFFIELTTLRSTVTELKDRILVLEGSEEGTEVLETLDEVNLKLEGVVESLAWLENFKLLVEAFTLEGEVEETDEEVEETPAEEVTPEVDEG